MLERKLDQEVSVVALLLVLVDGIKARVPNANYIHPTHFLAQIATERESLPHPKWYPGRQHVEHLLEGAPRATRGCQQSLSHG